jgi:FAD:protein FMN transferase
LKPTTTAILATILVLSIVALSVYNKRPVEIKYSRVLMGTVVDITIIGDDEAQLNSAAEAAFAEIKRLEGLMSHYKEGSDVGKINAAAGKDAVPVSNETFEVIEAALEISRLSNGAFDVTMGALGKVWHFTKDDGQVLMPPSKEKVKTILKLVDYRKIILDTKSRAVKLAKEGMKINLGGVAKGYITGRAAEVLKKKGVKKGIIHAGGDMVVFNESDDSPHIIGIQDPRNKDNTIGTIKISNAAIASSGDYERFFIKDRKRYHHIMDPSTGFPADKSMAVTIAAKNPTFADALSTAVFILGPIDGMKLIEKLPDVEGLIISADGTKIVSSGLDVNL